MPTVAPIHVVAQEASTPSAAKIKANNSRQKFLQVFPVIQQELLEYLDQQGMPADAQQWYRNVSILFSLSRCER